ncbi:MCE family protein [Nocardia arizonensis]|uniref:MCE family protein n=1 Tax=Nocardia arizonensis TaxID=1141647 RepID=UPI0006D0F81B|nr:MCE family protein [Nocardia arizonensis]
MNRRMIVAARLIAVLSLGGLAGCVGGPTGSTDDTITITAQFDSGAGLYQGNAVSVLGMPIGKVTRIDPKGTHVDVTMEVDSTVALPADVKAVTLSTSILTDRHVELTPAYRGGPRLADNAHIDLTRTKTPVELERLLAAADTMSTQLRGPTRGTGPIADLLAAADAATAGNGPGMRAALDQLSAALRVGSDGGAETKNQIVEIVDYLSVLARAAADNDQKIRDFGAATHQMMEILAGMGIGQGDTGAQINELLTQATALLENNRGSLKATVVGANTVTRSLVDYRRQLEEFIDLAPLMMDNAYNTFDKENRGVRVHALLDKILFDGQMVKEVCNILGLRQLGCSTGTLEDFGPDFGITDMLTALSGVPK